MPRGRSTLPGQKIKSAKVQAELSVNDATKLQGITGPFDLALDIGCFHNLGGNGQEKYLDQLDRILAPGGFWLMYGFFQSDEDQPRLRAFERRTSAASPPGWRFSPARTVSIEAKDLLPGSSSKKTASQLGGKPQHTPSLTENIMNTETNEIDTIAESLIFDLTKAFGLPPTEGAKSIVRLLLGKVAHTAAEFAMEVDCAVAEGGAAGGARTSLPHFVKSYEARGLENIPPTGPLIVASNHPAFIDSVRHHSLHGSPGLQGDYWRYSFFGEHAAYPGARHFCTRRRQHHGKNAGHP